MTKLEKLATAKGLTPQEYLTRNLPLIVSKETRRRYKHIYKLNLDYEVKKLVLERKRYSENA